MATGIVAMDPPNKPKNFGSGMDMSSAVKIGTRRGQQCHKPDRPLIRSASFPNSKSPAHPEQELANRFRHVYAGKGGWYGQKTAHQGPVNVGLPSKFTIARYRQEILKKIAEVNQSFFQKQAEGEKKQEEEDTGLEDKPQVSPTAPDGPQDSNKSTRSTSLVEVSSDGQHSQHAWSAEENSNCEIDCDTHSRQSVNEEHCISRDIIQEIPIQQIEAIPNDNGNTGAVKEQSTTGEHAKVIGDAWLGREAMQSELIEERDCSEKVEEPEVKAKMTDTINNDALCAGNKMINSTLYPAVPLINGLYTPAKSRASPRIRHKWSTRNKVNLLSQLSVEAQAAIAQTRQDNGEYRAQNQSPVEPKVLVSGFKPTNGYHPWDLIPDGLPLQDSRLLPTTYLTSSEQSKQEEFTNAVKTKLDNVIRSRENNLTTKSYTPRHSKGKFRVGPSKDISGGPKMRSSWSNKRSVYPETLVAKERVINYYPRLPSIPMTQQVTMEDQPTADPMTSLKAYHDNIQRTSVHQKLSPFGREKTFMITPAGYDCRYSENPFHLPGGGFDDTPEEIKEKAVAKCNDWLKKHYMT